MALRYIFHFIITTIPRSQQRSAPFFTTMDMGGRARRLEIALILQTDQDSLEMLCTLLLMDVWSLHL
jgi:hypothetical protein